MIATSSDAYQKLNGKTARRRKNEYDSEEIKRIIADGDVIECAALSQYFFNTNGLYKRIIIHYATFLTYSWILVPYPQN